MVGQRRTRLAPVPTSVRTASPSSTDRRVLTRS